MKKKLFYLLTLLIVLCGCSKTEEKADESLNVSKEPSEQEMEMIDEYLMALEVLNSYSQGEEVTYYDSETDTTLYDNLAVDRYYKWIQELDEIDQWVGTEYLAEEKSRENVLDSFVIVEDVLVHGQGNTQDRLGNFTGVYYWTDWNYDEDGKLVSVVNDSNMAWFSQIEDTAFYDGCYESRWITYDENGQIEQVKYGQYQDGTMEYVSTPEYDAAGKLISESVQSRYDSNYDITYSYNDENHVKKIKCISTDLDGNKEGECTYLYTYDKQGNVVKEECKKSGLASCDPYTMEYDYDENGNLMSAVCTISSFASGGEEYQEDYVFECDSQGRIITVECTNGYDGDVTTINLSYGDYYIYTPME